MMNTELFSRVYEKYGAITRLLIAQNTTIASTESCTAGLLSSLLTDTDGSSKVFIGSLVTYSNEAKIRAGVKARVIRKYGVYSEECAESMAEACRKKCGADVGIGVTGTLTGVDPNNRDSVPGKVSFAIVSENTKLTKTVMLPPFADRQTGKLLAADAIADALLNYLQ